MNYNPLDWYWTINGNAAQVFSSAVGDFVPVTAQAYLDWKALGNVPTPAASEADVGAVLAPYQLRPANAVALDGYTTAQSSNLAQHVSFKLIFNLLKRVAVLEGKAAPTPAQALAFAKSLM